MERRRSLLSSLTKSGGKKTVPSPAASLFELQPLEPRILLSTTHLLPESSPATQENAPAQAGTLSPAMQNVVTWVAAGSGNWNVPANWSGGQVPGPNDAVQITQTGITITSTGTQSVASLTSSANIAVEGGSLTLGTDSSVTGNLTVDDATLTSNGTLTVQGTLAVQDFALLAGTGAISAMGPMTISTIGGVSITALTTHGATTWSDEGNLTISPGTTWTNAPGATATTTSSGSLVGGGTFQNAGTFVSSTDPAVIDYVGVLFNNTGTVHVTSGTLLQRNSGTSSGIFNVDTGAQMIFSAGTGVTNYQIAPGAQWQGPGLYQITGFAVVTLNDASVNLTPQNFDLQYYSFLTGPGSMTVASGASWAFEGTGNMTGTGMLTVQSGGTLTVGPGTAYLDTRVLNNSGTVVVSNASLNASNGAILNNLSGGQLTVQIAANTSGAINTVVNNSGTITTSSLGSYAVFGAALNNQSGGIIHVTQGTLGTYGGGTSVGGWNADAGTQILYTDGGYSLNAGTTWSGTGTYTTDAGYYSSPVVIGAGANLSATNAQIIGDGTFTVNGALTIVGGGLLKAGDGTGFTTLNGTGTVTIAQNATMQIGQTPIDSINFSGNVTLVNNGTIHLAGVGFGYDPGDTIDNNGSFIVDQYAGISFQGQVGIGSFGTFNNKGSFTTSDPGVHLTIEGPFNNTGSVTVNGGSIELMDFGYGPSMSNGSYTVAAGATLSFSSDQTFEAGVSLNGTGTYILDQSATLTLNAASIDLSPYNFDFDYGKILGAGQITVTAGSTFAWNGGTIGTAKFTIQAGATVTAAGSSAYLTLDGTAFSNQGTLNVQQNLDLLDSGTFTNAASGQVNITPVNAGTFYEFGSSDGTGIFTNEGSVLVTVGPGGTVNFGYVSFDNQGVLEAAGGGIVSFSDPVAQISADGTQLTGGTWISSGGSTLRIFTIEGPYGPPVSVTENDATVELDGAGSSFNAVANLLQNNGSLAVLNGATLAEAGGLANGGTIEIGAGASLAVSGSFTQTSAGILQFDVGRTAGQLQVSGSATLGGTLAVHLSPGFTAVLGDTRTLLTYASVTGDFATKLSVDPLFSTTEAGAGYVLTTISTALPDLAVSGVTGPAGPLNAGSSLTVQYTVTNSGALPATGSWIDAVYLSPGTTFDPNTAVLLGRVEHDGGLGTNASYQGTLTGVAPDLAQGAYRILVVADSHDAVPETNRANDLGVSAQTVAITPPQLAVGTPVTGTIANGESKLYELDLPGNSQITLHLSTASVAGAELYVLYNGQPTPLSYDQMAYNVDSATEQIVLTAPAPGPYYILVRGRESSGNSDAFTLTAGATTYGITAVTPATASGLSTITLHGSQFTPDTVVTLVPHAGGAALPAVAFYYQDESTVSATFDLASIQAGTVFDVEAADNGITSTALSAVTVGAASTLSDADAVSITVTAPALYRTAVQYAIRVNYTNLSNHDVPAPIITLTATNALLQVDPTEDFVSGTIAFIGVNTGGGPAGVLPAGYQGSIVVQVQPTDQNAHSEVDYSYSTPDPTLPLDLNSLLPYLQSAYYTASQWSALLPALQARLGPTQAQYIQAVTRDATLLPAGLGNDLSPIDDLQLSVDQALADVTTSLQGSIASSSSGILLAGKQITAINATTEDEFSTTILNDGSFVLPDITAGSYTFEVDGALLGSSAAVSVAAGQHHVPVVLTATPGAQLAGHTLQAEDGQPLGQVSITAIGSDESVYTVESDAKGNFILGGLPVDTYTVVAQTDGRAREVFDNVAVGANGTTLNFSLALAGTVTGQVPAAANLPANAVFSVTAQVAGNTDPELVFSGGTDASGNFTISNLPAGTYLVDVAVDGYAPLEVTQVVVAAGQTNALGTLALSAVGTVSGKVTSTHASVPAAGLIIGAYNGDTLVAEAGADGTGAYSIPGLAPGNYVIQPVQPTSFSTPDPVTVSAGQAVANANLLIQPGGAVSGTVIDSANQSPLADFAVYASLGNGETEIAFTDANGNYLFQHLATGSYQISLNLQGSAAAAASVGTLDTSVAGVNLSANVIAKLNGHLRQSDGTTPAVSGAVTLLQNGRVIDTAEADANGIYTFILTQTGTYDLRAVAADGSFTSVTGLSVGVGTTTQDFTEGTGKLVFTVTDATQSVDGSAVALYQPQTGQQVGYAIVDSTGVATFGNLVAGNYSVVAVGNNNRGVQGTVMVNGGATTTSTMAQIQQAQVQGSIQVAGPIAAGATVSFYSTTDPNTVFTVPVGSDGSYSISNVPAGTYDAVAFANGYLASVQQNISIPTNPASPAFTMNFPLTASGTTHFTGTILDQNNNPIFGALVSIVNSKNEVLGNGVTDKNGRYDITSATGTGLTLRVSFNGDDPTNFFANTLQLSPDDEEEVPQVIYALGQANGSKSGFGAVITNFASVLQGQQQFTTLKAKTDATEFPFESDNYSASCPTCAGAAAAVNTAADKYNQTALIIGYGRKQVLQNAIEGSGNAIISEVAGIVGFATGLALLGTEAGAFFGVAEGLELTGAAAAYKSLGDALVAVKDFIDIGNALQTQGEKEPEDALTTAAQGTKTAGTISKDLIAVKQFALLVARKEGSKALEGGGLAAEFLSLVSEAVIKFGEDPFAKSKEAAENVIKQRDRFEEGKKIVKAAHQPFTKALKAFQQCEAKHSNGCGNNGGGGGSSGGKKKPAGGSNGRKGKDPNDLTGPAGYGDENYVQAQQPLSYRVDFENEAEADAATAKVVITEQLDANLDLSTFALGDIAFGDVAVSVPSGASSYQSVVNDAAGSGFDVSVNASLNVATRTVTWTFVTLDPSTGDTPADPLAGFLPPNTNPPAGQGYVTYTVKAKASAPDNTVITAQASVVFDANPAMATPVVTNALDKLAPTSTVQALPAQDGTDFTLHWSGSDTGSGVASYSIYYSDNGGAFQPLFQQTTRTAGIFDGVAGHTYSFYSLAEDNVGNLQPVPSSAQASTMLIASTAPAVDVRHPFTFKDASGDTVTVTITGPGTGTPLLEGGVATGADLRSLSLTGTTAATKVKIVTKQGTTTVGRILTTQPGESVGSITLGASVTLGDGSDDGATDLLVTGGIKTLSLGSLNSYATFDLGSGLTGTPLAALKPVLTAGTVLGPGVEIDSSGGFGAVKLKSWAFPGDLTAANSIGSLTLAGAMNANLTAASVGNLQAASFGYATFALSGTGAGNLTALSGGITDFLFTADNGKIGNLSATVTKATGDATAIEGLVATAEKIGNVTAKVSGTTGLLTATGIGASFLAASSGAIGQIVATVTGGADLTTGLGIDATPIISYDGAVGNVTATVTASGPAADLVAMRDSPVTAGTSIGRLSATATDTAHAPTGGSASGIAATTGTLAFQAGTTIGAIHASAKGAGGLNSAIDGTADAISFTAGGAIGTISAVDAKGSAAGSTAWAIRQVAVSAGGALGAVSVTGNATAAQVSGLSVYAGKQIAGIAIAANDKIDGTLQDSAILAGQAQEIATAKDLVSAGLGFLTLSGSLVDTGGGTSLVAAQGNIGAVKIGGDFQGVKLVAGLNAGADQLGGTADDSFNGSASITSVTVGKAFLDSSIVAGIAPETAGTWGGDGDAAAGSALAAKSKIGAIVLGSATAPGTAPFEAPEAGDHAGAIEARTLTSLKIGTHRLASFSAPSGIDANGDGVVDSSEIVVRVF